MRATLMLLLAFGCNEPEPEPSMNLEAIADQVLEDMEPALQEAAEQALPAPEIAEPYEEGVDAQEQIDAALANANGKRVLLVFGANWCPWCRRLEHTFRNAEEVSELLRSSFEVVHVDVGPRDSDTNRAVAARYGNPLPNGLPCLVVLDADGEVAHVQETGSLEEGDHHDRAQVSAFLQRWRPQT